MIKPLEVGQVVTIGNRKNLKVIEKIEVQKDKFDYILQSLDKPEKNYRYFYSGVIVRNY